MARVQRQQTVLEILQNLRNLNSLKGLFWEELNYERANKPLSTRGWPEHVRIALADDPILFATGGEEDSFHIVYCRLASQSLSRSIERAIISQLISDHPYCLYVFSEKSQLHWHLLNVKYDEREGKRRLVRRISIQPGEGLRTAAERIQMIDLATFGKDLLGLSALTIQQRHDEAFDVEKVTKDFYEEIANWYFWAREHAEFPKDAPLDADSKPSLMLIRLLTRLIFCWFLREKKNPQTSKGLIPDDLFEPHHIKNLIRDASPDSFTYYTAILQNLFFATLNTEMDQPGQAPTRRFIDEGDGRQSDDHMVHQLWRHTRQLRDPEELANLLRDIPFLNGGLFECFDDRIKKGNSPYTEEIRIDGFSTDPKKQPKVPNFLFFGAPQAVDLSEAYGDSSRHHLIIRPLLDILSRYNFTLTENTPFDQEVALDPELLGHVLENLLAAYNPETGMVARKATGSFYTPRVVVDWIVDQTLIAYLKTALSSTNEESVENKLKQLVSWDDSEHSFNIAKVENLIDAIDRLKVIDPACGSGAFPMGMLQKLVHVLKKLDPDNKGWKRRQVEAAERIESGPAREEALKAIDRAFTRDNDDYGRKLYLIENCLYGVDIQPIAVQISKLRFFISLVVDQNINPGEDNYGILPLPNLETKVVAANTLLGLHRGQLILGSEEIKCLERELQKVRHDYFTARSYRRKKELRTKDRELCTRLSAALSESGECTPYDAKRLAEWNPYDTNTPASFFDPGWMFGLASKNQHGVFDIVFGNPPYVRQEELKNQTVISSTGQPQSLKDALKGQYECYTGTADLYVYFFERSLQLLRVGGALGFITSNKYFRAGYGELLRTYLRWSTRPIALLDFGDAPVFTSIAYPAILVTQKTRSVAKGQLPPPHEPTGILHPKNDPPKDWRSRIMTWIPGPDIREFPDIFEQQASPLAQRDLKPDGWRLESPTKLRLLERLRQAGTPLSDYVQGRFYRGILTGLNEAFVVDRSTRDGLIAEHESSIQLLKPFLRGRDVKRWRCEPRDLWLIFTRRGIDIIKYPAIYEYLQKFKKQLTPGAKGGRKPGSYKWYEIQDNIAYWQEFERPKIIYPNICSRNEFAWDELSFYANQKTFIIPHTNKFLLSYLNSSVVMWLFTQLVPKLQNGFYEPGARFIGQFPIPSLTTDQHRRCERLADALIWLYRPTNENAKQEQTGLMTNYFEQWLNGLIYELFFSGELHARRIALFDETAKLNIPSLADLSEMQKMVSLQETHAKAYERDAPLRSMLFDLRSLEVVRIIEDAPAERINKQRRDER